MFCVYIYIHTNMTCMYIIFYTGNTFFCIPFWKQQALRSGKTAKLPGCDCGVFGHAALDLCWMWLLGRRCDLELWVVPWRIWGLTYLEIQGDLVITPKKAMTTVSDLFSLCICIHTYDYMCICVYSCTFAERIWSMWIFGLYFWFHCCLMCKYMLQWIDI